MQEFTGKDSLEKITDIKKGDCSGSCPVFEKFHIETVTITLIF